MKAKRKIIQIAITPESECDISLIAALCDDGSVWSRHWNDAKTAWKRVSDIPQDDESKEVPHA